MIDIKAAPFNLDDEGVKWVEETKQNMTLEEKIGQLMIPIGYSADPGYLQHVMLDHHIGGILYRCGESEEKSPVLREKRLAVTGLLHQW